MNELLQTFTRKLMGVIRKPGFWIIVLLFIVITLPHHHETFEYPSFLNYIIPSVGLTRHTLERILFIVPVVWSGFLFGLKGTVISSIAALIIMLPRAIFLSEYPSDAIFESLAIFFIGGSISGLLAFSSRLLRRERQYLTELETTHQELTTSEERYRQLFENAHDAILVQDMDGNILTANKAAARLTGYDAEMLVQMNVTDFLSEEGLELAKEVRQKLLKGLTIGEAYEQQLLRKDKSKASLILSTSLVTKDGQPVGFQLIARDITEEKRLQENLEFYLQQSVKAQEEERKRISRELHDDTIQALVVLSRQLDNLASNSYNLTEDERIRLDNLQKQTTDIMQGVRRLSQDLRPAALDRLGLLPALEWLVSDVMNYSGLETKINTTGNTRRFPEEVELVLFRITQEALRNTWRHSKATEAEINVEFGQNGVKITIIDNGKGFNPPQAIGDLAKDGKLGLAGMLERARLIGGNLTVESEPEKGTKVIIELSE
jgi:two-component system sensor histidine kinase DegS